MLAYNKGKSLSEMLKAIYQEYGPSYTERLDIPCPAEKRNELLKNLQSDSIFLSRGLAVENVSTIDQGVKYLFTEGDWLLARPSGTEPLIRVYLESYSRERFNQLKSLTKDLFEERIDAF